MAMDSPGHFPLNHVTSPTRWNSHQQLIFGKMMACFPSNYLINTNFLQKCFVIPLKAIIFFLFQEWHAVISAWLLLMQCNLILLGTSYSSYICLIIQQLIGIFQNCWYKKDKKKYSSPYIPQFIWAGYDSHILNLENMRVSRFFPCLYGRGAGDSGIRMMSVCTKLLGVVPRQTACKGQGRWELGTEQTFNPTSKERRGSNQTLNCCMKTHETP